eukprot:GHVU01031352.1.p1 GENE.GHVU01031352.1~~GHVU01031352.1.p1  ORF type:complete len:115 (+),score=2.77 GHVU01031352.1:596-940(+)
MSLGGVVDTGVATAAGVASTTALLSVFMVHAITKRPPKRRLSPTHLLCEELQDAMFLLDRFQGPGRSASHQTRRKEKSQHGGAGASIDHRLRGCRVRTDAVIHSEVLPRTHAHP